MRPAVSFLSVALVVCGCGTLLSTEDSPAPQPSPPNPQLDASAPEDAASGAVDGEKKPAINDPVQRVDWKAKPISNTGNTFEIDVPGVQNELLVVAIELDGVATVATLPGAGWTLRGSRSNFDQTISHHIYTHPMQASDVRPYRWVLSPATSGHAFAIALRDVRGTIPEAITTFTTGGRTLESGTLDVKPGDLVVGLFSARFTNGGAPSWGEILESIDTVAGVYTNRLIALPIELAGAPSATLSATPNLDVLQGITSILVLPRK